MKPLETAMTERKIPGLQKEQEALTYGAVRDLRSMHHIAAERQQRAGGTYPEDGGVLSWLMVDATRRRGAQDALHNRERCLEMAEAGGASGIWEYNLHTGESGFNGEWRRMLGFPNECGRVSRGDCFARIRTDDRGRIEVATEVAIARLRQLTGMRMRAAWTERLLSSPGDIVNADQARDGSVNLPASANGGLLLRLTQPKAVAASAARVH
jgi:hypothetical protein